MEILIEIGAALILGWLAAIGIIVLLGSFLGVTVEGWGALLWKPAVLSVVTVIGFVVAYLIPLPLPFLLSSFLIPGVFAGFVLVALFEMDFVEDWQSIGLFLALYLGIQFLAPMLLFMLIDPF
ncbi:MAG: hypothetical protein EA380_02925 [Phycisphaeraceae bacterium]|nr:MAG: hypothetical protein EA380_02925 [Phycisphaeraceae bacterium]